jgi:hypothetical protein
MNLLILGGRHEMIVERHPRCRSYVRQVIGMREGV